MVSREDRRDFERLKLAQPILANWNGQSALILDIGVTGAFVEHHGTAKGGDRVALSFRWQNAEVEFQCDVVRSVVVRPPSAAGHSPMSQTGVRFAEAVGEANIRLQDMMVAFVSRLLAAHRANAAADDAPDSAAFLAAIGQARRTRMRGFLTYRRIGTKWSRKRTESPDQPSEGFTVAAFEDEEDLETLCRAYEAADEEARGLIRLVAQLSAMAAKK